MAVIAVAALLAMPMLEACSGSGEVPEYVFDSYYVYSSIDSNTFHDPSCDYMSEPGSRIRIKYAAAIEDGMGPCAHCKPGKTYDYVICNKESKIFHDPHCSNLPGAKNRLTLRYDTAMESFTPCSICNPKKVEKKMSQLSFFAASSSYSSDYGFADALGNYLGNYLGTLLYLFFLCLPGVIVFFVKKSQRNNLFMRSNQIRAGMSEYDIQRVMADKKYTYSQSRDGIGRYTYTASGARGFLNLFAVSPLRLEIEVKEGIVVSVQVTG